MADKHKSRNTALSFDKEFGRFCAKLGKKHTRSGKQDGHKFGFTTDKRESMKRKQRIQEVWDCLIDQYGSDYLWTEQSPMIAKSLEKGQVNIALKADDIAPWSLVLCQAGFVTQARFYAGQIAGFRHACPTVNMVRADVELYE